MSLNELLGKPPIWSASLTEHGGIIVSSRVRLARNLAGAAFPGWAGEDECEKILGMVQPHLMACQPFQQGHVLPMSELSALEKQLLFERYLISRDFLNRGRGSALIVSHDQHVTIMVNEEDHLRMHTIWPGLNVRVAWQALDALDTELSTKVEFAFSSKLGFLTACPTNVGTGLRASVMLHLPGLVLQKEIEPIIRSCAKIGLTVRGLWGEGTDAVGNMFQISNQFTLGAGEDWIVSQIEQIVSEIVEHEKNARARLMEKQAGMVSDYTGRAFGVLRYAYRLSSREALDLLSALRLGLDEGIIEAKERSAIDGLLLAVQPAHLQWQRGRPMKSAKARDWARAELVRNRLREAEVHPVEKKQKNE